MKKTELVKELKNAVKWLTKSECGCVTIPLDDFLDDTGLAVCVGFERDENDYVIVAGIKAYLSDSMRTDYDFINFPYFADKGDCIDTTVIIAENDDYNFLAEYFLKEYNGLKKYYIDDDGKILGLIENYDIA